MATGGVTSHKGAIQHLSKLTIVLLGGRYAGKSSAGNTILGREEFESGVRTAQCVKRKGGVAGRQVTVVDTPGWWSNIFPQLTPELVKQEIVCSASLCPPGCHVFLLVMDLKSSFSGTQRKKVKKHLKLLGERVWRHTIVLFTRGDWLGGRTIEQCIGTAGEPLQWLVEKCGNRYHVLNNKNSGDGAQVTELLEKIEMMMAELGGQNYEMDRKLIQEMEERRRAVEEKAKQRWMDVQEQRKALRNLLEGKEHHLSELRIVLLGARQTGKSSAGNTILGREEFEPGRRTAQCVKRQGEVAGKQVTVVDTPGWWWHYTIELITALDKQEIVCSVSLCPPGPHALLLVIDLNSAFPETYRKSIEQHMGLLSDTVWRHTMVLFTSENQLQDTAIEQHIETEGAALQWLVEKCGNRYHVLSNADRDDVTQVTELLKKIEEMVAGYGGQHCEFNRMHIQMVEERRRAVEEKAKQRWMKVQNQRKAIRALFRVEEHHLSELRIVLLGGRQTGKSSAGNTILGREEFESGVRTAQCVKRQGKVAGKQITVVETPGWSSSIYSFPALTLVGQEIVCSVSLCPPGPHAFLLVIDLSTLFPETNRRPTEERMELLGESVWRHTMVLFTCGDWLGDTSIEEHIETEGTALQWLVEKCGNRYHVLNNENRDDGTQVTELLEKIEEMVAKNNGCYFTRERRGEGYNQWSFGNKVNEKKLKQNFEEEWRRREEELIERMSQVLVKLETGESTSPVINRKSSIEHFPPSLSGGSPVPSEASSSVGNYRLAHEVSRKKVSWWMRGIQPESLASSGYGTRSSVVSEEEMPDTKRLEEDSVDDTPN
ncbi:GTPase IMAP family member 8-like [Megalops cyprinoides]|uniref:GTPase IMAP family member 8-like n=1 Tax=Megalops cyprinoides TaxID=118141 RepID=UPI00186527F9|nr:GTPase IMAP family member 8-like [Megalops cyprinoides]